MDFKVLIKDFIFCKGDLQLYINRRFKNTKQSIVTHEYWDYAVLKNGCKFYISEDFTCIDQVIEDYRFSDITKDTTVVDLGANIGGFTIQAAKMAKKVIAYEPIRGTELVRNIELNGLTNVECHFVGVGNGFRQVMRWGTMPNLPTVLFEDIVSQLPKGEHLAIKIDVEGAERYMEPTDIATFDRVEMELHSWGDGRKVSDNIISVLKLTHNVEVDNIGANGMVGILHATRK